MHKITKLLIIITALLSFVTNADTIRANFDGFTDSLHTYGLWSRTNAFTRPTATGTNTFYNYGYSAQSGTMYDTTMGNNQSAQVKIVAASTGYNVGVLLRVSNDSAYAVHGRTTDSVQISFFKAGTINSIDRFYYPYIPNSDSIMGTVIGDTIRVYINNFEVGKTYDNRIPSGKVGVYSGTTGGFGVRGDNFKAWTIVSEGCDPVTINNPGEQADTSGQIDTIVMGASGAIDSLRVKNISSFNEITINGDTIFLNCLRKMSTAICSAYVYSCGVETPSDSEFFNITVNRDPIVIDSLRNGTRITYKDTLFTGDTGKLYFSMIDTFTNVDSVIIRDAISAIINSTGNLITFIQPIVDSGLCTLVVIDDADYRDSVVFYAGGLFTGDSASIFIVQSDGGTVTSDPAAGKYEVGTPVTFSATPDAGYEFTAWGDHLADSVDNPVTVVLTTAPIVASAVFTDTTTTVPITSRSRGGFVPGWRGWRKAWR